MSKSFILSFVLLSACTGEKPAVPTEEQADQLNEAEDLLNELSAED